MSKLATFVRRHGFDVLIPIAALESALEVALRHDPAHEPTTPNWFAVPAVALIILPLLHVAASRSPHRRRSGSWVRRSP